MFVHNCLRCVVVIARGCNADCRTKRCCTPFFLACKEGHQKVSQLLLEHSTDPEVRPSFCLSCMSGSSVVTVHIHIRAHVCLFVHICIYLYKCSVSMCVYYRVPYSAKL